MIKDLAHYSGPMGVADFDFCVVGGGVAGITIASQLAKAGCGKVALMEGGGLEWSNSSQQIYDGEVVGDAYMDLTESRLRYLGGSSNHWGGWCRPLDAVDFEKKRHAPAASWPIKRSDLAPFLLPACELLGINPAFPVDAPYLESPELNRIAFHFSDPPRNFAEDHHEELKVSKSTTLFLNANLIGLQGKEQKIVKAKFANFRGASLEVRAKNFVLAMGGIENSRLMLWTNEVGPTRLFDPRLPIGRYWMEHPHFTIGDCAIRTRETTMFYLAPSREAVIRHQILNCGLRVEPKQVKGRRRLSRELTRRAPNLSEKLHDFLGVDWRLPAKLRAAWEQLPCRQNKVTLSKKYDHFGIPQSQIFWSKTEIDLRTPRVSGQILKNFLETRGLGTVELSPWLVGRGPEPVDDELGGNHHMGGTRMAENPEFGVVDTDCRVHGLKNLFIAGSSVFPSSGHANPTLTIVQLSLRLAKHLVSACKN